VQYLIDTSVIVPCLRRATKPAYLRFLETLSDEETPVISVITRFEVFAGTVAEYLDANRRFLDGFQQITVTAEVADEAGRLCYDWSRKGFTLAANDLIIGASTRIHELSLVTNNLRHFPYLGKLKEVTLSYQSSKRRTTTEVVYLLR
jgi:predicted nucleic acid-binding protein